MPWWEADLFKFAELLPLTWVYALGRNLNVKRNF
jgi:hypothetical protein